VFFAYFRRYPAGLFNNALSLPGPEPGFERSAKVVLIGAMFQEKSG
jgi:hypothetical protein